jgi:hypothetical protein
MVAISLSGSGEGPGWVTAPGYSPAAFSEPPICTLLTTRLQRKHNRPVSGSDPPHPITSRTWGSRLSRFFLSSLLSRERTGGPASPPYEKHLNQIGRLTG